MVRIGVMRWSFGMGRIRGIALRMHVTFLLLLAVVGYQGYVIAGGRGAFWSLALISAVFVCIILHELGHSLVAQQLGVEVRSITLLPIGGVASLKTIPENPWHEIAITVAGPMVNVVAAAVLMPFAGLPRSLFLTDLPANFLGLLNTLVGVNIWLFLFNCIPAFPMDGGRLLRAILALVVPYRRATWIAVLVGQALAIVFLLVGLYTSIWLVILGAFIFIAADGEEKMVRMRSLLRDIDVEEVMMHEFTTLLPHDTVGHGLERVYQTGQDDFPVVVDGQLVGMASRQAMLDAINRGGNLWPVGQVMDTTVPVISLRDKVSRVHDEMMSGHSGSFPVMERGALVGLLSPANISRYLLVQGSIKNGGRAARVPPRVAGQTPGLPPVIASVPPIAVPPPPGESGPRPGPA